MRRVDVQWAILLATLFPDLAVWVVVPAEVIMCTLGQLSFFTLTVPPSTQKYKLVPSNCWKNLKK